MATEKGIEFIKKYKGTNCLKSSWEMMYRKGHITLDEYAECAELTEEEKAEYEKQIDICDENPSPEEQLMDMAKMILDLQYQIDVLTLLNQEG